MADIIRAAEQFRAALLARDRAAGGRLVAAYGLAWTRLQTQLSRVTEMIEAARARGETPGISWLGKQERYATLLREIEQELRRLAEFTEGLITASQRAELARGAADAAALLEAGASTGPGTPAGEGDGRVSAGFNRLPTGAVEQIVGTLGDGSPLARLLGKLPGEGRAAVEQALIEGVALGENPRKVARRVRDAFGGSLTRALTVARTEQLRAYRESSRATWRENEDRVAGWQWLSARQPGRTCASCWAMHGQIFPLDTPLGSHPVCRCTQVPVLKSAPAFIEETGEELFAKLKPAQQLATLGPAKFAAYQAGSITLRDLVGIRQSKAWGTTRSERGLKDALQGEASGAKWGKMPKDHRPEGMPAAAPEPAEEPLPRPPLPAVEFENPGRAATLIRSVLGRDIEPQQLAAAAGALDGSSASLYMVGDGRLEISIRHPYVADQIRTFAREGDRLTLHNDLFVKRDGAPPGVAAEMLWQQVNWAELLGILEIRTEAAGSVDSQYFNGYYTWPRLGYNADLSADEKRALPSALKGARTVQDLMATPEGRVWWRQNGRGRNMRFDLRPGSRAREILARYIAEKRRRA